MHAFVIGQESSVVVLGATEFGSRPGASIGDVKRWLGHTASSNMADLYMRPVKPEYREVVYWLRAKLTRKGYPNDDA